MVLYALGVNIVNVEIADVMSYKRRHFRLVDTFFSRYARFTFTFHNVQFCHFIARTSSLKISSHIITMKNIFGNHQTESYLNMKTHLFGCCTVHGYVGMQFSAKDNVSSS